MSTSPAQDAWTIGRLLSWTTEYFGQRGLEDARLTAEVLLAHAAGCRRIDLYTRFEETLASDALAKFRTLVKRASGREPAAYLVEEKEFYSLAFRVTPAVLIPRPETETLVDAALELCRTECLEAPVVLDVGTGSGCIAIALAKQLPASRIVATDISEPALEIAQSNARRHGVTERMTFVPADRLALPAEVIPSDGFDLLISNPPYIAGASVETLDPGVRLFEPSIALTDGGDGLSFFRSIAAEAGSLLKPGGHVLVEVADGQADDVRALMTTADAWMHVRTIKDQVTRRERVLMFRRAGT